MTSPHDRQRFGKYIVALHETSAPLLADLSLFHGRLQDANSRLSGESRSLEELSFWGKAVVSGLFAHMDAVGFRARQLAFFFGSDWGLELSERKKAELMEQWKKETPEGTTWVKAPLSPTESFKLGVKYLSRMAGPDFSLDTGREGWAAVLALWEVRKRFMHPKRIEDLSAVEMFGSIEAAAVWYPQEMMRLFGALATAVGLQGFDPGGSAAEVLPRRKRIEVPELFPGDELWSEVGSSIAGSLRYALELSRRLSVDGKFAHDLLMEQGIDGPNAATYRRLSLWVRCAEVEAQSGVLEFLLEGAVRRGDLSAEEAEIQPIAGYPRPAGHLLAAANLWSRHFGRGVVAELSTAAKVDLREAWARRDRLIHPKDSRSLELSPREALDYSLAVMRLQQAVLEVMPADPERLIAAEKSRRLHEGRAY